ncbi:hypothetical protein, partial [Streptomyces galilaeus]|uniref:hypothetical protein n=1 Tax=Streptomyces galilaeus TaxID=33899 RepID=UPI0038F7AD66
KPIESYTSKNSYDAPNIARQRAFGWLKYNKQNYVFDDYTISTVEVSDPVPASEPESKPEQLNLF